MQNTNFQLAVPADSANPNSIIILALVFSLPELWEMECGSVEDYCLEKKLLQSFRLVPVYHLFLDIVACVPLFL